MRPTKPYLVWDTCAETQYQADYLREENPELTEDEAFNLACQDTDLLTIRWQDLLEDLDTLLRKINPDGKPYKAIVENFGWRNLSGEKTFKADNASAFLRNILPQTDCTFNLFVRRKTIRIQNSHHDSPMGNEWYTVRLVR